MLALNIYLVDLQSHFESLYYIYVLACPVNNNELIMPSISWISDLYCFVLCLVLRSYKKKSIMLGGHKTSKNAKKMLINKKKNILIEISTEIARLTKNGGN